MLWEDKGTKNKDQQHKDKEFSNINYRLQNIAK